MVDEIFPLILLDCQQLSGFVFQAAFVKERERLLHLQCRAGGGLIFEI